MSAPSRGSRWKRGEESYLVEAVSPRDVMLSCASTGDWITFPLAQWPDNFVEEGGPKGKTPAPGRFSMSVLFVGGAAGKWQKTMAGKLAEAADGMPIDFDIRHWPNTVRHGPRLPNVDLVLVNIDCVGHSLQVHAQRQAKACKTPVLMTPTAQFVTTVRAWLTSWLLARGVTFGRAVSEGPTISWYTYDEESDVYVFCEPLSTPPEREPTHRSLSEAGLLALVGVAVVLPWWLFRK